MCCQARTNFVIKNPTLLMPLLRSANETKDPEKVKVSLSEGTPLRQYMDREKMLQREGSQYLAVDGMWIADLFLPFQCEFVFCFGTRAVFGVLRMAP